MTQQKVRIGIIGMGGMGSSHARNIISGNIEQLELTAVCDRNWDRLAAFPDFHTYTSSNELIRSGNVDAVLIATPHYAHTTIGIESLEAGLHLLVEKPISVHKADCERLISAYESRPEKDQVFAVMFNQRTDQYFKKIHQLVHDGELGAIQRINWIITDWFRPAVYYSSGGWRATWEGEGGGVLLNQCPHQLDLFQWTFGIPARIQAHCHFGKYHSIEVEDEVTAYMEYANGATATFITSTGEAPGTNRLEITGDNGKLVYEDDHLYYLRNETPTSTFSQTTKKAFSKPPVWEINIPAEGHGGQHVEVLQNFTNSILGSESLIASGFEGIHSVELANAMLMSAWLGKTIELPLDGLEYQQLLEEKIRSSTSDKIV